MSNANGSFAKLLQGFYTLLLDSTNCVLSLDLFSDETVQLNEIRKI